MKRVLVVGSAEQSGGGVASVIRLMKKMPVWDKLIKMRFTEEDIEKHERILK